MPNISDAITVVYHGCNFQLLYGSTKINSILAIIIPNTLNVLSIPMQLKDYP